MDISHGCYSGPPGNFDALRLLWSEVAGYGIADMRPIGGPIMPDLDLRYFCDDDFLGEWPHGAPEDPLLIILVHREDAGRIKANHCPYLADRLEQLEGRMMAGSRFHNTPTWVLLTQQFIRGLRSAAAYKQDVVFS